MGYGILFYLAKIVIGARVESLRSSLQKDSLEDYTKEMSPLWQANDLCVKHLCGIQGRQLNPARVFLRNFYQDALKVILHRWQPDEKFDEFSQ